METIISIYTEEVFLSTYLDESGFEVDIDPDFKLYLDMRSLIFAIINQSKIVWYFQERQSRTKCKSKGILRWGKLTLFNLCWQSRILSIIKISFF